MQQYINDVEENALKLNNMNMNNGFVITDEWSTAVILAGLTEKYQSFIMGFQATGQPVTANLVTSKLLDLVGDESSKGEGFFW